ncbi:hypothetical protein B3C1_01405 [Gallaecimonas xiamenensis 3-C-1]|uniref:M23ase beta-sheet core domain-containing protein n=1 Tax=Gallaecimonas xiamenensis 3-C-1 TaxID=745411 RepID=K2J332_9GAMM|nr:hypothetical protein B3C1_01405 [Gallaecimonas xiamenensis 3-C-1]
MKDILHITVSGNNGTRHLALTVERRKALLAALAGFVVFLLLMFGYIRFLQWQADDAGTRLAKNREELATLADDLTAAREAFEQVEEQRLLLETSIARKTEELSAATERLDNLEDKLGSGMPTSLDGGDLAHRLDLASIAMSSREVTLNLIPNGHPLEYAYISSGFGKRKHPVKGRVIEHAGLDLVAHRGTPVHATADGVVELVSRRKTGYGNMILVSHAFGFKSRYAHLKSIEVKRGAFVHKGDVIAYSGNTGTSTGPHLHYEVTYAGFPLNPKPFVDWQLDNYEQLFDSENQVPWPSLLATIESLRTLWQPPLSQQEPYSVASLSSPATSTSTDTSKESSEPTKPFVLAETAK